MASYVGETAPRRATKSSGAQAARRKRAITAGRAGRSFKSEPKRQSNWTRHLNQSKPIRLRALGGRSASRADAACEGREMLQSAVSHNKKRRRRPAQVHAQQQPQQHQQHHRAREGNDAPEKDCRPSELGRMSIIINQTDHETQQTTATAAPPPPPQTTASDGKPLAATSDKQNRSHCNIRWPRRQQQWQPAQRPRHRQMISTATATATMKPKLTRRCRSKSKCGRPAAAVGESLLLRRPLAHKLPLLMAAAICLVSVSSLNDPCYCDSESARPNGRPGNLLLGTQSMRAWPAPLLLRQPRSGQARPDDHDDSSLARAATRRAEEQPRAAKLQSAGAPTKASPGGHGGQHLSALVASIERQHWGFGSPGGGSQPAHADGSSPSAVAYSSKDIIASHERRNHGKPSQAGHHHWQAAKSSKPPSKAEQDLQQIMLLHEANVNAVGSSHALKPKRAGPSSGSEPGEHDHKGTSQIANTARKATRWLATTASAESGRPFRLLGAPSGNILSGVITSLLPTSALGKEPASQSATPEKAASVNATSSAFTPRANAKNYLMGPLLGLGQMLLSTGQSPPNPFYHHDTNQSVYSKPANSLASSTKRSWASSQKAKKLLAPSSNNNGPAGGGSSSDISITESSPQTQATAIESESAATTKRPATTSNWIKDGANQLAQSYFQDSFRNLLTLSQLPILSGGPVSTAPSDLEPGGKKWLADRVEAQQNRHNRTQMIEDLFRYAYILGNVGVRRKRDPLKVLGSSPPTNTALALASHNTHGSSGGRWHPLKALSALNSISQHNGIVEKLPTRKLSTILSPNRNIKPRGVMWDMATDPTLAVTVFHLLERASVALPLGFLLMPFVHMIRHPLSGMNLGRILPARASHRSVDYEELVKRIDMMDKILSRAMRPTHREASIMG